MKLTSMDLLLPIQVVRYTMKSEIRLALLGHPLNDEIPVGSIR